MPDAVNTASAFTIREITGQRRVVRLVDRALPYRPFTLSGSQRSELTWYPGNPEGTQQVFGPSEDETTIRGFWKDKFLGNAVETLTEANSRTFTNEVTPFSVNNQRIETVREASKVIDDIRRQGQSVEVTWDEITRVGIVKEFEQSWHNRHDLEWSITFEWSSRGEPTLPPTVTEETSVSETAAVLQTRQLEMVQASRPDFAVSPDFVIDLNENLRAVDNSIKQVTGASQSLTLTAISPFEATRRTIASATGLVDQTTDITDRFEAQPSRALMFGVDISSMRLGQILASESYSRGVTSSARTMRRESIIRRAALSRNIQSDLLGTYNARNGEDLRDVSRKFYGTPFEWRRLMSFNMLESSELSGGQVVLVPRIQSGEETP